MDKRNNTGGWGGTYSKICSHYRMPTSAPAISRVLRRAGFFMVHDYSREGLRVHKANHAGVVQITASFDARSQAQQAAHTAAEVLRGKGYAVQQNGRYLAVTKPSTHGLAPSTDPSL